MIWPLAVQGPRVPLSLVFTPLNSKLAEAKTGGVPCECNALTWVGAPPHDFTVGLSASLNKSSTLRSSTRPEQQHALLPLTRTGAPLPSRHTHVQRIPSTCNGNILLSEMSLPLTCLGAPPPSRPRPPWRPRPAHARTQSLLRMELEWGGGGGGGGGGTGRCDSGSRSAGSKEGPRFAIIWHARGVGLAAGCAAAACRPGRPGPAAFKAVLKLAATASPHITAHPHTVVHHPSVSCGIALTCAAGHDHLGLSLEGPSNKRLETACRNAVDRPAHLRRRA